MKHLLAVRCRGSDSFIVHTSLAPGRAGWACGGIWCCDTLLLPSPDGLSLSLLTLLTLSPVSLPHSMGEELRPSEMAVLTNAFTCS